MFFRKWQCSSPRNVLESWNWFSEHFCVVLPKSYHQNRTKWRAPLKNLFFLDKFIQKFLENGCESKTNICCRFRQLLLFLATWTLKLLGRNFWYRDPPDEKKTKTRLFRKKSAFLTSLNIQHHIKKARNARNFCRTPKFSTSNVFFIPVKKSCYGFGRLRWTLTLRNLKILIFFEKFDIFENFENFRFWNFLKNFWILHPSKIHNMIWKISWYDVINMF